MATVHPSSILRAPDEEKRRQAKEDFIADMTKVAEVIHRAKGKRQRAAALQDAHA